MRFLTITRKQLMLSVALLLILCAVAVGGIGIAATADRQLPIYCVETDKKQIAVSFDAAWGNDDTQTLVDILAKYEVPATFFVVGAWVDKYPESVKALADAGHRVENHSNTHPYLTQLSPAQITDELTACNEKIAAITGRAPTLLRPPYGDYDNNVICTAKNCKMTAIQWSVDSLDWKETATAESIARRVISKVCPGSIVLFHNDADHTPEALPTILETLKKEGYEFVFISDLLLKDNFEIDHTGKQCIIK